MTGAILHHWRTILATGIVLAALALILVHSLIPATAWPLTDAKTRRALARVQLAYRTIEFTPISELADRSSVLAILEGLDVSGQASEAEVRAITELAADFFTHRFTRHSPEAYRLWRARQGYQMLDAQRLRSWRVAEDYAHFFGEAFPGDDRLVEAFDRFFSHAHEVQRGRSSVTKFASGRGGAALAFGDIDPTGALPYPPLRGALSTQDWQGVTQAGFRSWWIDPHGGLAAEFARAPATRAAVLALIAEFKPGDRYPIVLRLYKSSVDDRW